MRLDQVGYLPDDSKRAYLMTAPTGRIRFKVENARGRTVLTGTPGRRTGSWNAAFPSVRVLDLTRLTDRGTYRVAVSGPGVRAHSPWFRVGPAAEVLGPLLPRLLRFFQAQRDGPDVVPSVLGRRPSHLADRAATVYRPPRHRNGELVGGLVPVPGAATVDVSGGWADAGDFLKFTTTASYSTAVLYYAYRAVPSEPALAAEADHGLKWLDKMWDERTGTLYAQVGIGIGGAGYLSDHDVWRLPESDDMRRVGRGDPGYLLRYRPVFRAAAPGARISPNLAGRVAAAFALAAQIRARDDPGAARRALERAASIYARADTAPGGGLVTTFPHGFYPETSWADDLEFGTVELARAARALGDRRADGWLRQAAHWAATVLRSDEQGPLGISDVSVLAHTDLIEALDQSASNLGIGRDELVAALEATARRRHREGRPRSVRGGRGSNRLRLGRDQLRPGQHRPALPPGERRHVLQRVRHRAARLDPRRERVGIVVRHRRRDHLSALPPAPGRQPDRGRRPRGSRRQRPQRRRGFPEPGRTRRHAALHGPRFRPVRRTRQPVHRPDRRLAEHRTSGRLHRRSDPHNSPSNHPRPTDRTPQTQVNRELAN
ncbi:glycoside hydrolase family 9 protein [Actinomadura madurae]|nr:glycoside hydrolase family 9 protein [Actinomadura madurae]URN10600.1 glycoside hydrolase family 9 protein [Actinomadura madurae]